MLLMTCLQLVQLYYPIAAVTSSDATRKAKKPIPWPTATKDITKDILFGNDDLLGESPPKETTRVVDQKRVTEIEKQIQKEIKEDDDLFSSKVLSKKPTTTISDELFGDPISTTTSQVSAVPNKDTTDAPPSHKVISYKCCSYYSSYMHIVLLSYFVYVAM